MEYLLAVDIGTTSTKCMTITPDGNVLSVRQSFYPTSFSDQGFAEQDPELIYKGAVEIIQACVVPSAKCVGISFSSAMHSITAVDQQGNPLLPLIIWSDLRSKEQFHELERKGFVGKLCAITGTPVHPMTPLCKLLWLKENQPDVFLNAHKFISIKEFIFYRLTGKFIVDYSIASATGIFDIEKLDWAEEVLNLLALPADKFSTTVPISEKINLIESKAKELRLDENTPIIAGASDGCLAQLGSGAMDKGDLTITLGTSGAVRIASSKRLMDSEGKIFNYLLHEGEYICGGPTNSGTAIVDWFAKNFNPSSDRNIKILSEEVESIPAGSEGLMMLPYLLGERAPIYDPDARGVFFGVSVRHTPLHFQKALLEGICFELMWILELIEKSVGVSKRIFVSGGITHAPKWLQMLSNVLGRELILSENQDASSLGAAIVGFESLGIELKLPHDHSKIFSPNAANHKVYTSLFPVFKKLYSQTNGLFKDLNKISEKDFI